jgi:D-beta-D-heptose 7-phosphate kinase/D-beta-D-heptose 1-phosphate adenosyltransferase
MRNGRAGSLLERKIKGLKDLQNILFRLKAKGRRIVFTNGCFDLLHYGHASYLEAAKSKGDILVVGVNSDGSVRRIKGKNRPVVSEKYRARGVAALESVDYVIIFRENNPLKAIKYLKPDMLVKGADWNKTDIVGRDFVESYGGRVITVKLVKGFSTTNLLKNIAKAF